MPAAGAPEPGIAALEPGACAVVPVLAVTYSPLLPLIAVMVPSPGATRRVSSTPFRAVATAACAAATSACCASMPWGRSAVLALSPFCAVTTAYSAFSTASLPEAASTFFFCWALTSTVLSATTFCFAAETADSAVSTCVQAAASPVPTPAPS